MGLGELEIFRSLKINGVLSMIKRLFQKKETNNENRLTFKY